MVMATLFWIGLLSVLSLGVGFTRHSDGSIEANEFRVSKIDGSGDGAPSMFISEIAVRSSILTTTRSALFATSHISITNATKPQLDISAFPAGFDLTLSARSMSSMAEYATLSVDVATPLIDFPSASFNGPSVFQVCTVYSGREICSPELYFTLTVTEGAFVFGSPSATSPSTAEFYDFPSDWTIELVVLVPSSQPFAHAMIMGYSASSNGDALLISHTDANLFYLHYQGSAQGFSFEFTADVFHHIALTKTGNTMSVFMDGEAQQVDISVSAGGLTGGTVILGADHDQSAGNIYTGGHLVPQGTIVKLARVWKSPLDSATISNLSSQAHSCSITPANPADATLECTFSGACNIGPNLIPRTATSTIQEIDCLV